jgi:methylated-DNA-[protein]-cysteine S-methyltransferase
MKFYEKVWMLMKKIPRGRVTTYGLIARKLNLHAYRAVGQACKRNPYAPKVPCHRVVESSGKVGNYSGSGGIKRKIQLLKNEGIKIKNKRIENFEKVLYKF